MVEPLTARPVTMAMAVVGVPATVMVGVIPMASPEAIPG